MITVRVRHSGGTLRIKNADPTWTIEHLSKEVHSRLKLPVHASVSFSLTPPTSKGIESGAIFDDSLTLQDLNLTHGSMLYLNHQLLPAQATTVLTNQSGGGVQRVDIEGNLVRVSNSSKTGFRPGLLSLRDQKLHWTLNQLSELDSNYTFVIKGKEPNFCSACSLDMDSAQFFQRYCQERDNVKLLKTRVSLLFGRFVENAIASAPPSSKQPTSGREYGKTKGTMRVSDLKSDETDQLLARLRTEVECMLEVEVETTPGLRVKEIPSGALAVAKAFGLECVGIAFCHGMRKENFSAEEILLCGEMCLEMTQGAVDSPFVIVKVFPDEQSLIQMESFQLTKTCLEMMREEVLVILKDTPFFFGVEEKFTVMIEAKASEVVDCDYFIKRVPIQSHKSTLFHVKFALQSLRNEASLKLFIKKVKSGKEWRNVLKDFHLLYFLTQLMGEETVVDICHALLSEDSEEEFPEGFSMMIQEVCS